MPTKPTTSWWLFPPTTQEVQLDEKWSFVAKKQKPCQPDEARCGDCWDHVALDAESRLVLSVVVGKRTDANACPVVHEVCERTDGRPLNLITTDEYPAYATALAAVYAEPAPAGEPAPEAQRLPDWLVYATVHKVRENNRVVKVETRLVFGTLVSLAAALVWAVLGCVSTVFIERCNGTDRHRNSRKVRKTYRFSKDWEVHRAMTVFTLYSANFCWGVRTLREEIIPKKRYRQRTAAMVAGLADHVWTLEEWLSFPSTKRYQLPPFRKQ
jgi:IS1 family transposase